MCFRRFQLFSMNSHHIQIVFTGTRPGEKLFEEVRLNSETAKPTLHLQIVITDPPEPSAAVVAEWTREALASACEAKKTIRLLHDLIPEFRSPEIASDSAKLAEPQVAPIRAMQPLLSD